MSLTVLAVVGSLHFQFSLALVVGRSMAPSYESGDLLLARRHAYRARGPARGDLVLARYRGDLIVKRVVGLPGEEVEIRDGLLHINGFRVPEPWRTQPGRLQIAAGRLLPGRYALLGDNRALLPAETVHAIVRQDEIVGKVVGSLPLGAGHR